MIVAVTVTSISDMIVAATVAAATPTYTGTDTI